MSPFTTDPAEKVRALTTAIAAALDGIDDLTVYAHGADGFDLALPAATVRGARLTRTRLDDREQRLDRDDWNVTHFVTVYVPLDDPDTAWGLSERLVGECVYVIDADWQLGGEVQEARVVQADWSTTDPDLPRRLIVADLVVQSISLMPRT